MPRCCVVALHDRLDAARGEATVARRWRGRARRGVDVLGGRAAGSFADRRRVGHRARAVRGRRRATLGRCASAPSAWTASASCCAERAVAEERAADRAGAARRRRPQRLADRRAGAGARRHRPATSACARRPTAIADLGRQTMDEMHRTLQAAAAATTPPSARRSRASPTLDRAARAVARARASTSSSRSRASRAPLAQSARPVRLPDRPGGAHQRRQARRPRARRASRVGYAPDALELTIADERRRRAARPAAPGGHGLVGMRERAALFGGTLDRRPARRARLRGARRRSPTARARREPAAGRHRRRPADDARRLQGRARGDRHDRGRRRGRRPARRPSRRPRRTGPTSC